MPGQEKFPLADLIAALGRDLREAQRRAAEDDRADLLKLKECSIEVGVTWERKGEAGLELWVVKLGGGVDKTNTQTISITMEPVDPNIVIERLQE